MYNLVYCPYGCTKGSSFGFDRCNCNCGNNSVGCNAPFGDCNCASGYSSCPPGLSGPDCTVPNNPCGGRDGRLCHNGLLLRCERGLNVSAITCTNGCHDADDSCACPSDCNNRGTCLRLGNASVMRVGVGRIALSYRTCVQSESRVGSFVQIVQLMVLAL
jgi:hypothetical protein